MWTRRNKARRSSAPRGSGARLTPPCAMQSPGDDSHGRRPPAKEILFKQNSYTACIAGHKATFDPENTTDTRWPLKSVHFTSDTSINHRSSKIIGFFWKIFWQQEDCNFNIKLQKLFKNGISPIGNHFRSHGMWAFKTHFIISVPSIIFWRVNGDQELSLNIFFWVWYVRHITDQSDSLTYHVLQRSFDMKTTLQMSIAQTQPTIYDEER